MSGTAQVLQVPDRGYVVRKVAAGRTLEGRDCARVAAAKRPIARAQNTRPPGHSTRTERHVGNVSGYRAGGPEPGDSASRHVRDVLTARTWPVARRRVYKALAQTTSPSFFTSFRSRGSPTMAAGVVMTMLVLAR